MKFFAASFLLLISLIFYACSDNSTTPTNTTSAYKNLFSIDISDLNIKAFVKDADSLTTGYNDLYFKVSKNSVVQTTGDIRFEPIMWMSPELWHTTPVSSKFKYDNQLGYFKGFAVFLMATSTEYVWRTKVTYEDSSRGLNLFKDSVLVYSSYHVEKAWKLFFDSTDNVNYFLTLVKPFAPGTGTNTIQFILHQSDNLAQHFLQINSSSMSIDVFKTDTVWHTNGNIMPVADENGYYSGSINLPYKGKWSVSDSISYNNHSITHNPTPTPQFDFTVQ